MNTQFFQKTISPAQNAMNSPLEKWFYGLLNSVVVGGSTAVASALGLATAHGMGVSDIPQVSWHMIEVVFVAGAVSKFFIYLAQGLPALQNVSDSNALPRYQDEPKTANFQSPDSNIQSTPKP